MGQPVFRFQLQHAIEGTKTISEPDGWKDAKLKLERHPDYHSLIEYFEGDFIFYGSNGVDDGGINFIKTVENLYGVDSELKIIIDVSFDEGYSYQNVFTGLLDLSALQEVKNNKLSCPIINSSFWSKFISRKETPINLKSSTDLDGITKTVVDDIVINLTSQKIQKQYSGTMREGVTIYQDELPLNEYIQYDFDNEILSEIKRKYTLFTSPNPEVPVSIFDMEEDGDYEIDIRIEMSIISHVGGAITACAGAFQKSPTSSYIDMFLYVRNAGDFDGSYNLTKTDHITDSTSYTYSSTIYIPKNSQVTLGARLVNDSWKDDTVSVNSILIYGDSNANLPIKKGQFVFTTQCEVDTIIDSTESFSIPSGVSTPSYMQITAQTVKDDSVADAYLIHDVAQSICDRITGNYQSLYSEYFGGTLTNGRTYASDGCAWNYGLLQGLQIRGYTFAQKQFSLSFDKWWKGANPIFNLSLGYETIGGVEVIRIEEKAHVYDRDSNSSVNISNVREISREYDNSKIYKKIEVGYQKWQSESISGIDDPQTKRVFATRFQKVGTDLTLYSEFMAASIAIEVARRQSVEKSADYKLDNDIFIIHLDKNDVSSDVYEPRVESTSPYANLLNGDTRYNTLISATRNLYRHLNVITGCLYKYLTSSIKFQSGEGNYTMGRDYVSHDGVCMAVTTNTIYENTDISMATYGNTSTTRYLHLPELYQIEIYLSWEEYSAIRSNRKKTIGISQTASGHKKFFIKELEYEICKSKCKMQLWPAETFQIQVIS